MPTCLMYLGTNKIVFFCEIYEIIDLFGIYYVANAKHKIFSDSSPNPVYNLCTNTRQDSSLIFQ